MCASLDNVGWDRHRSSSELVAERRAVYSVYPTNHLMYGHCELLRGLPNAEFSEVRHERSVDYKEPTWVTIGVRLLPVLCNLLTVSQCCYRLSGSGQRATGS